jgi:hypothetical protein
VQVGVHNQLCQKLSGVTSGDFLESFVTEATRRPISGRDIIECDEEGLRLYTIYREIKRFMPHAE